MMIIKNEKGGVQTRIISAVVTIICIAIVLVLFINKKSEIAQDDHRKATQLSDKGFQVFMESTHESLLQDPMNIKGIEKEEYQGGWYEVKVSSELLDSICSVNIKSIGGFGKSRVPQEKIIKLVKKTTESNTFWTPLTR